METPPRPSETITDRLARQVQHRLAAKLTKEFDRCFPHVDAGTDFYSYLDKWQQKVEAELSKRPATRAEITALEARAWKAIRAKLLDCAKQTKQPRYKEATRITTGEVWSFLCPDDE